MKKHVCLILALLFCFCAAGAEPMAETTTLAFEDGFSLEIPAGWMYYSPTKEMAARGVVYRLSDASARHWLYIQIWNTDCAGTDALKALIDRSAAPQTSGIYSFGDADFVVYNLPEGDVSCSAVLLNGRILNFVFTPQSDAGFMATATQIISSFQSA